MSNIKQDTIFVDSGLDHDSDERYIAVGDSVYNLNILVSEEGAIGTVSNAKGTNLAIDISEHILSLSDSYTTLGSYYNRLTRKVYYLVFSNTYDSGGGVYIYDNKLFCFDEDKETLDLLFTDTANYFGLDPKYPLRDMDMLGDWLYFTPRVSEPKMIDVVMAYNYTNYADYDSTETYVYGQVRKHKGGLFVANQSVALNEAPSLTPSKWDRIGNCYREETELAFDSEFRYAFNVIKMPPPIRPTVSYGSDTYVKVNNVRGRVFRFSYRYKYFDDTYSVYSSYSDVTLPEDDEKYNGEVLNTSTTNNFISVGFYLHSPALVKEVELVVQETGGDWRRVKIYNRQIQDTVLNSLSSSAEFYNNESYVIVDNVTVAKIQDSVPLKANSQAIINKNILSYGGCLEGQNNVPKDEISVNLIPVPQIIEIPPMLGDLRRDNNGSGDISTLTETDPYLGTRYGNRLDLATWFGGAGLLDGDLYTVTIDGRTETYMLTASDVINYTNLSIGLRTFLNYQYPAFVTSTYASGIDIYAGWGSHHSPSILSVSKFNGSSTSKSELTKKTGFKTGANHPFCIFYYDDNMRRWDAQTSYISVYSGSGYGMNGTTVYVPMINEVSPVPVTNAYRWVIDWEVYHLPPAGAKYWRWGYAGNTLCSYMVQYIVTDVTNSSQDQVKVNITPLQTLKTNTDAAWNVFPMSVVDAYEWQPGDRIRFITEESVPGAGTDIGAPVDGVYDFEIIRQDDTDNSLYLQGQLSTLGLDTAGVGENTLVEIYTPLKALTDTKKIYYEFGDLMNIIEDSAGVLVHEGQASLHNQSSVTFAPAMGTFDGGDIYHIVRTPSKPLDTTTKSKGAFHESMWYSDFYESQDWDKGKIGFETTFGQRFLNIVRYSNQYLQDTMINGLSTFEGDSLKTLNDIYGDIVAIYEQGDTLKVYQERKASSILIGRTEYMDAQGNTSVAISERVLGAIRYSPSNYSTIFPESVSRNNKFIYGFDIYNGVVWRDSVNGLFPISGRYAEAGGEADYKMMSYFKQKAKDLMRSGVDHVSVLTVWDEEYKMLYVIFKDYADSTNNETVAFHEPSNRWVSFYSFGQTPALGWITPLRLDYNVVLGFPNGIGHTFNDTTGFDEFDFATPVTPEDTGTYIVDEDDVTYITDEDGETFIIE